MKRRKSRASKPVPGRIRKYLLPKPEEFRAVARAVNKASSISAEDFFMAAMLIDQLEAAAERVRSGEKSYWEALLDWAMGVVRFQRKVGIRRLQKLFQLVKEVYEQKQE